MAARSAVSEMLRTRGSRVLILHSLPQFRSLSDSVIGLHTILTLTPPQYRLPYYWYLDAARQEEFNRNIESLADWIEGAIKRSLSGVKNSRVIQLHDINHYVRIEHAAVLLDT